MANAHVLISSQTLGSAVGTVTFSSIPQSYRDLRMVITSSPTATTAGDMLMQLNGDAGTNYTTIEMTGNGSTANSISYSRTGLQITYRTTTTTLEVTTIDLLDYSATDKHKTALSRGNVTDTQVAVRCSRWANTAAVTSLACLAGGSTWAAGSTFYLYGIAG